MRESTPASLAGRSVLALTCVLTSECRIRSRERKISVVCHTRPNPPCVELYRRKSLSIVAQHLRQRRRREAGLSLADDFNVGGSATSRKRADEIARRHDGVARVRNSLACCCLRLTPAHQVPSLAGQRLVSLRLLSFSLFLLFLFFASAFG